MKIPFSILFFPVCISVFGFIWYAVRHIPQPSNDRNWEAESAIIPTITIEENRRITFEQLRDWRYDATQVRSREYVTRTYDVSRMQRMWFISEPFGAWNGIAHTYFVFDFDDQPPLAFSIEARKEVGETYSAVRGLMRSYELFYLWGTEEDLTIRRAVFLKNPLYMYPVAVDAALQQQLILTLARATQNLEKHPRFYNTLTQNCTNTLADIANTIVPHSIPALHPARYFTGYADQLLYNRGYIDQLLPFDTLKKRSAVTAYIQAHAADENFSANLRTFLAR